jgi:hypothetical protein
MLGKDKHPCLYGPFVSAEEKKFDNIDSICQSYKTFF